MTTCVLLTTLLLGQADALGPGETTRSLKVGGQKRTYLVHVPPSYDRKKPMPLVLALHGLAMTGKMMEYFSGLSKAADRDGFIVVYPNGTGGLLLAWNTGALPGDGGGGKGGPDDIAYLGKVLDDVERVLNVDRHRVYATGMSNGAMMTYKLASAMPDRIAAIAPVGGTMPASGAAPTHPVPVIHFHGTEDTFVPYKGVSKEAKALIRFLSVPATIATWVKANGCAEKPRVTELPERGDKLKVIRKIYDSCKNGADVVLITIEGGGHTWPGLQHHATFLGRSTRTVAADDLMWDFFRRHPRR